MLGPYLVDRTTPLVHYYWMYRIVGNFRRRELHEFHGV